ncbi:hypothetical protein TNCV_3155671 [Trichonephila clavipes]|nr:hypothetical protein TNCV_3155671 [Trichonephila clavipes]
MRFEEQRVKSRRAPEPTLLLWVGTSVFRRIKFEFVSHSTKISLYGEHHLIHGPVVADHCSREYNRFTGRTNSPIRVLTFTTLTELSFPGSTSITNPIGQSSLYLLSQLHLQLSLLSNQFVAILMNEKTQVFISKSIP